MSTKTKTNATAAATRAANANAREKVAAIITAAQAKAIAATESPTMSSATDRAARTDAKLAAAGAAACAAAGISTAKGHDAGRYSDRAARAVQRARYGIMRAVDAMPHAAKLFAAGATDTQVRHELGVCITTVRRLRAQSQA